MSTAFPSNSQNDPGKYQNVKGEKTATKTADAPVEGKIIKPIVTPGSATKRKTPLGKKFKSLFIQDSGHNVAEFVLLEVLVPAARDMARDAIQEAVHRVLYGDSNGGRRITSRPGGGGGLSSNSTSSFRYDRVGSQAAQPGISKKARQSHDFGEIVLRSRPEAQEIIDMMFTIVSQFDAVTVADLYEMCEIDTQHTDRKYGWTDLRGAGVVRVNGGYLLDLPRPSILD